ncbi:MAG: hypothetical protein AAF456_19580 [Planctomycetota bacterium]
MSESAPQIPNDQELWRERIRSKFPDWGTTEALKDWSDVGNQISVGQEVSGTVISRAPFGVWLDIGLAWPALLRVVNMCSGDFGPVSLEQYPAEGTALNGRVNAVGDAGEIGLTQQNPDALIEGREN